MIVLDLFAGAGGAALGLASLGLDPVGIDRDRDAAATHHAAGFRTVRADLERYPFAHLRGRVDVLHASPPCQPFSAAGDRTGAADDRDGMPWTLRAVDEVRPRVVTVENVPGLLDARHRRYLGAFVTRLAVLGYRVEYRVLCAADYGVPQTRRRVLIVARLDGHIRWPRPTHAEDGRRGLAPWVSMAEALGWGMTDRPYLTVASSSRSGGYDGAGLGASTSRSRVVAERDAGRWRLSTGMDWRDGTSQVRVVDDPAPTVSGKSGGQWWRGRPATTVAGDVRVHPPGHKLNGDDIARGRSGLDRAGTDAVRVTLEELAALQSFPADHPFHGTRTSIARQIGNALPPPLLAAVVGANLG